MGIKNLLYRLDRAIRCGTLGHMTDTHAPELIKEIETFLELTAKREMFTSGEIQDLLLDLRGLLSERVVTL